MEKELWRGKWVSVCKIPIFRLIRKNRSCFILILYVIFMKQQTITTATPFKVCFVCLGNICRSPTAEGIFQHLVEKENLSDYFVIDSAGTSGWHIGEPANSRSRMVAEKYGVRLASLGRQIDSRDLDEFDLVLAMDDQNLRDIQALARSEEQRSRIRLMREFDPEPGDGNVPDPYYGGMDGFENVFRILYRSCESLLDQLKERMDGVR